MKIKAILSNKPLYESDSVLLESLRSLQLMQLSVETLKATEIGRTIQKLVRALIQGWKVLVDEWVKPFDATTKNNINVSISVLNIFIKCCMAWFYRAMLKVLGFYEHFGGIFLNVYGPLRLRFSFNTIIIGVFERDFRAGEVGIWVCCSHFHVLKP
ncbi:hypothetical protein IEQ34_012528 [Dendrobium chrysotoxum]|uniref:TFIIS N-terminal domain-containing protein n=1 Tax=Dendrobium chrysotoxum TaxID=161865 RepID=A0AAV7GVC1_DENCH|nr:hypothetical protein IEQ34_012528 [Dendrobium chrysotoxum]